MLNDQKLASHPKFPIEPTNSKSNSWVIGATRYHAWCDRCARWKKNVPFSGDRCKSLHEETVSSDRSGRPVVEINTENVPDSSQTRSCHESERFNVGDETLRERSGWPVVNHDDFSHEQTMLNKVNMDFRIPGLPHSVVKHAYSTSVRELIQKIENHLDRHALQQDLRQNQAYNPFSPESKKMIKDLGNVELFELFDGPWNAMQRMPIILESRHRLLHLRASLERNCGQSRFSLNIHWTFFQFQSTSSSREDLTATDMGNSQETEYHLANNVKRRCIKRDYQGIHDRFLRDHVFRGRMIENSPDEEVCQAWDVLADEDQTCHMSQEESFYNMNNWWLHLNKSGNDTQPLRKRSDFKQALSTLERLHQEPGGEQIEPIPYWKYKQWKPAPSSSSTWWQWTGSWWSSQECKESQERGKQSLVKERGDPLSTVLWQKPQMVFKNSFYFVTDRSFTADGGLL